VSNIVGVRVPPSAPAKLYNAAAARKQIVNDVATLRHGGEMKSQTNLWSPTLVVVLCVAKIVTS
jgi:hypothetical protein